MNGLLPERLKEKRAKSKLTQKDVADRLGITQSTYAYYESGRNEPDLETLTKIADIFETSLDYLAGRYK